MKYKNNNKETRFYLTGNSMNKKKNKFQQTSSMNINIILMICY